MVSKEIFWPYGGREVFVSFYFNGYVPLSLSHCVCIHIFMYLYVCVRVLVFDRWTEPIPMIPVEGSSKFFHLIQDLPSGRHQVISMRKQYHSVVSIFILFNLSPMNEGLNN